MTARDYIKCKFSTYYYSPAASPPPIPNRYSQIEYEDIWSEYLDEPKSNRDKYSIGTEVTGLNMYMERVLGVIQRCEHYDNGPKYRLDCVDGTWWVDEDSIIIPIHRPFKDNKDYIRPGEEISTEVREIGMVCYMHDNYFRSCEKNVSTIYWHDNSYRGISAYLHETDIVYLDTNNYHNVSLTVKRINFKEGRFDFVYKNEQDQIIMDWRRNVSADDLEEFLTTTYKTLKNGITK